MTVKGSFTLKFFQSAVQMHAFHVFITLCRCYAIQYSNGRNSFGTRNAAKKKTDLPSIREEIIFEKQQHKRTFFLYHV